MPTTIRIPQMLRNWPWERVVHPYYEVSKKESLCWIRTFHSSYSAKLEAQMEKADPSLLGAMCLANLHDEGLTRGCDYILFALVYEVCTDECDVTQARAIGDIVMDALRNPSKPRPEGELIIGEIARQFWDKTIPIMSLTAQRRFIASFQEFVDAVVQESEDRAKNTIRTMDGYIKLRRGTVAMRPMFAFCEMNMDIPEHVMANEVLERLRVVVCDLTFMSNDVLSYNREKSLRHDFHNLVTIIMKEYEVGIQEAFDKAGEMFDKAAQQFLEDVAKVPSWSKEIDECVQEYIDSLGKCITGSYQWSFEVERYFGKDGSRVLREGTVPLLPLPTVV